MSLTNYRTLGRSGLRVSPFCLGAMTFGEDWGWGATVAESEALLARFIERGGNFIDTANGYTRGHSEAIIGGYFARAGRRDRAVIATKFSTNLYIGDPNGGGAGRKTIVESCEQSLRRLKTDYIDLYWMHFWDPNTPIDETMRALDDLVRAGKVRYIGVSDTPAWKVTQANLLSQFHGWSPFVGLQVEYSLIERTVEGELVPMALELGLGITPWSPLRGGVLSGKYTRANAAQAKPDRGDRVMAFLTERNLRIIDELIRIAGELGTSPAGVALAWVQSRPGVTSTIIGARRLDQLDQNLAALDITLRDADIAALNALSEPALNFPSPFFKMIPTFAQGGTTVNGTPSVAWPMMPKTDAERY
ncbi:MAG: aldo/keto reductase [Cyanobacteria bacterium]|nr:aldo/keto reductase [Cyanobacteriota bacterium]